jgi:uncharacterized phage-like protein YoqJ
MEENKYIVWHIEGGLGKNVAATALIGSLKDKYLDRKIVIAASYPEVFLNHPAAYRVYRVGNTQYFYDDFIKDKDTIVFKHEPYFQTNHILRRKHLIENWCDLLGIDYDNQQPVLNFNLVQQRAATKWSREKPILVLQTALVFDFRLLIYKAYLRHRLHSNLYAHHNPHKIFLSLICQLIRMRSYQCLLDVI